MTHTMKDRKLRSIASPAKAAAALIVVLFCGGYSIFFLGRARWPEAIGFGAVTILFLLVLYFEGSILEVSSDGVCFRFLWHRRTQMSWQEIQEVGVMGERVLRKGKSKRVGTLYIYFSPRKMTDRERMDLALKPLPRKVVYTVYSKKKIEFIQLFWQAPITLYNEGDLEL